LVDKKLLLNAIYIACDMGAYLSKPNCDKESEDKEGDVLSYGASAMQGWRLAQEVRSESRKVGVVFVHFNSVVKSSLRCPLVLV